MKGTWIRESVDGCTVVFIHGILSSGDKCWRHENGTHWPNLLASENDMNSTGIYEFTYKTDFFSGTYRLSDVVDTLKEFLKIDGVLKSNNIVFVCHSMGGIVARKFIVERAIKFVNNKSKLGLFLLASPSLGSKYANWLGPLARLLGQTQAEALRFSENNTWLMDLDHDFKNLKEGNDIEIVGKELVEDTFIALKKWFRKQIVPPLSGSRYFGESYKVPDSDHFSISKLESREAIQHRLLVKFIKEFSTEAIMHSDPKVSKPKQEVLLPSGDDALDANHATLPDQTETQKKRENGSAKLIASLRKV